MLVRGLDWSEHGVRLNVLAEPASVPLEPGSFLGFRVIDGRKHCLGFSQMLGETGSKSVPCPDDSLAERGYQCGPCFARDEFRAIHDIHRGGQASAGLKAYVAQPHWLYIATFARGASKVGTASQLRKWARLAEQGAIAAQYIALADDGRTVRLLEDSISSGLGIPQQIRSASKFSGLLTPDPLAQILQTNAEVAAVAREHLAGIGLPGFQLSDEHWELPEQGRSLLTAGPRIAYPLPLNEGSHGIQLNGLLGSFAWGSVEDQDFLLDLGALKGRILELGQFESELPALQDSLF